MRPRPAVAGLALLLAPALATGCANESLQRAAVAAAKCYLPVAQRLHVPAEVDMQTSEVQVTELGHGRYRVTGMAKAPGTAKRFYTCELAPDPSDKLRGFRVTALRLSPHR